METECQKAICFICQPPHFQTISCDEAIKIIKIVYLDSQTNGKVTDNEAFLAGVHPVDCEKCRETKIHH